MLAKRHRLTTAAFNKVYKAGKRVHHPLLQLIYQPGEEFHGAVVVGKKVFASAVKRNRLRRQIYDVLYQHRINEKVSGTYLVLVKPAAKNATAAELRAATTSLIADATKR